MVAARLDVKHGACSFCGAEGEKLLYIKLQAHQEPKIIEKPANVHSGWCRACLSKFGHACINASVSV